MMTIGKAFRMAICGTALMLMAMPGISAAAEPGGTGGMQHGDHAGMKMEGHEGMPAKSGGHDMDMGEKIFSGRVGPWAAEARLVDIKAQMEKSGVSAKTAARFAGRRHMMLFLTDPASGKPASEVAGKVVITGPDKASSSKVTLVPMGTHIGVDVNMPAPGKYTFKAEIESGAALMALLIFHAAVPGAGPGGAAATCCVCSAGLLHAATSTSTAAPAILDRQLITTPPLVEDAKTIS